MMITNDSISNRTANFTERFVSARLPPDLIMVYNIYLYLMIILGVLGNTVVLVVYSKYRLVTTTDWFIIFITFFDFLSSAVHVPVYVTFTNGVWQSYGTSVMCKIHMFVSQSIVLSSSILICGLSMDRYFKICRPHSSTFTTKRVRNFCISICFVATVMSVPAIFMFDDISGKCTLAQFTLKMAAYYFVVFLTFLMVTLTVVVAYTKVSIAIRHRPLANDGTRNAPASTITTRRALRNYVFRASNKISPTSTGFRGKRGGLAGNCSHLPSTGNTLAPPCICHSNSRSSSAASSSFPHHHVNVIDAMSERRRRETSMRVTKIAFLVCFIFVVTWIPPWVVFFMIMIPGMRHRTTFIRFMQFGKMTHLLNTVTNPLLYTWLNTKFRERAKKIFYCK